MISDSTVVILRRNDHPRPSHPSVIRSERRPGHQRRYAPKTRTGCITCKIRRVKCDEGKPFCKKCTSTGRKCDGYAVSGENVRTKSPGSLSVSWNHNVTSNALERRTFEWFRSKTVPSISGYFQDSVWNRLVLQLSHSEPAVRFAVNALGALHEETCLRQSADQNGTDGAILKTGFPLMQYFRAIKAMENLVNSGSASLDAMIICYLLCAHFEGLRESFVPSLIHAENAIQLLQSTARSDTKKVNPVLACAVVRMDLQISQYLHSRVPALPFYAKSSDLILPDAFQELTHARDLVNSWTARLFHFVRTVADEYKFQNHGDVPLEEYAHALELEQTFVDLHRLLCDLMHRLAEKLTPREQHGLTMLRSRTKINRILAGTCLYMQTSAYDRYISDFDAILNNCIDLIGSDDTDDHVFSAGVDEGLIRPLFFIAMHCRDSQIRHQALEQLERLPGKDGNWHVETTKRTSEMLIRLEEASCDKKFPLCEDIPEWRRIQNIAFLGFSGASGTPNRKVRVQVRFYPNGMDGGWQGVVEEFPWTVPNQRFEQSYGMLLATQLHTSEPAY